MMYESNDMVNKCVASDLTECKEAKPIAPAMEDTVDVLVEIHLQLSELSEFLFGDIREPFERPATKCLEDAVLSVNGMAKYALERIMNTKKRIGA